MRAWVGVVLLLSLGACAQEEPESVAPLYDTAPVETRPIEVSVDAAGVIEPEITVEVKSKASGEILAIHAETGDVIDEGFLLVEVDQRTPRNTLAEAEASLVASKARRDIAETQMARSETLYGTGVVTETEYEQAQLEYANAQAQVISAEVAVENSRIAMDDTEVRAPITGTIIEKNVEQGTVISSPTRDVSGGTILLRMADLTTVHVRTLVDETDIGKITPGMTTRVTVAAYPNQPFAGEVLKIEPQAIVEQNVTMFAVLIRLENRGNLLKPGMNADVAIRIASRDSVAVVPTMALRADADIPAAAAMLGLEESQLRSLLGRAAGSPDGEGDVRTAALESTQFRALITKRRNGETLTVQEEAQLQAAMKTMPQSGGGPDGFGSGSGAQSGGASRSRDASIADYQFGGDYWVVVWRDGGPVPVPVRTGVTDHEFSEIVAGLDVNDEVLLLPSSSLYGQQEMLQKFISERFSSTPFQQGTGGGRFR